MTAYLFSFAIKSTKFAIAAPCVNRWLALMALSLTSYRRIAASPKPKGESCV